MVEALSLMFRFLAKLAFLIVFAAAVAAGVVLALSRDPYYTAADWLSRGRYRRYDAMIADAGAKYGLDPLLLKALVWRESEFHPHKTGSSGERGLMQVSLAAANDWVRAHKAETFEPADLFSPRMNLEIGAWYLRQKLNRWAEKDDPVPFALAEYNAGGTRVDQWIARTQLGEGITAADLRSRIPFPTTRAYVETILLRYAFYQEQEPPK